jgi:hypothetical protein
LSESQIDKVLEEKRRWIYKSLAEWHDLNSTRVERQFVNGEGFLYLGRSYRLKLVPKQAEPLLLKDGYFCLRADLRPTEKAAPPFETSTETKGSSGSTNGWTYFKASMDVEAEVGQDSGSEESLGLLDAGRQSELPLEVHDGPAQDSRLHRGPRTGPPDLPNHSAKFWNESTRCSPITSTARNGCECMGRGWICDRNRNQAAPIGAH